MHQPECRKKTPYYIDTIKLSSPFNDVDLPLLKQLYIKNGFSTRQMAKRFGVSKSFIIGRLHCLGIKRKPGQKQNDPKDYRHAQSPYGYKIKNNCLVLNKEELKICRLIVSLIDKKQWSASKVARELTLRGTEKRSKDKTWNHPTVIKIYNRWKDKL